MVTRRRREGGGGFVRWPSALVRQDPEGHAAYQLADDRDHEGVNECLRFFTLNIDRPPRFRWGGTPRRVDRLLLSVLGRGVALVCGRRARPTRQGLIPAQGSAAR